MKMAELGGPVYLRKCTVAHGKSGSVLHNQFLKKWIYYVNNLLMSSYFFKIYFLKKIGFIKSQQINLSLCTAPSPTFLNTWGKKILIWC